CDSMRKQMKILIVAKQNKIGIRTAKRLEKTLKNKADVHLDMSTAPRLRMRGSSIKKFDGDLVITVGGDGTFLRTAHQTSVPILPVKIEGHGFLCSCTTKELTKNLENILKKDYQVVSKIRMRCASVREGKIKKYLGRILHKYYPLSLNEIVFTRKRPSKILEIEFKIDNSSFTFKGDGLMISTPSGSTAYSASAGGSVIDPSLEVISIVPLYPFFSHIKPMIIPVDKKIEVVLKNSDCMMIIDGQEGEYLKKGTRIMIEKGDPAKIVHLSEQNLYEKFKKEFMK
ncbi:MAG: NAD(+)/NADH kinase, partial [Candidatus Aenigmatarchaeota archaeon]